MIDIGLNLFSVAKLISDEKSLTEVAVKLRDMGYTCLQFSGGAFIPERIKRVSKKSGMPFVLTHVSMDRIISDTEKLIDEHLSFGCHNIGLGVIPVPIILDEPKLLETVEKLNRAAEVIKKNGCKFFYHNHHFEFMRLSSGQMILDYMLKNAPFFNYTADTYWIQYGGVEINAVLEKLKGRIECVHLKDYKVVLQGDNVIPTFAPVGDGNIDFAKIIKTMKENGTKYFIVEQDDACNYPDPLAQVERSVRYLKANFNQ